MSKILDKLNQLKEVKLDEMYNPNNFAWEYSKEYMAKLHRVVPTNPFNAEPLEPEMNGMDFIEELRHAVHQEQHEVEIQYEDGRSVLLDVEVVKHILANASVEQILWAKETPENMKQFLEDLCGQIVTLDCDGEEEIIKKIEQQSPRAEVVEK